MKLVFVLLVGLYMMPVANAQEGQIQQGQFQRRGPPPNFEAIKAKIESACANDVATLCQGLEGRDAMKCLHKNKASVSDECRAAIPPRHRHVNRE